MAKRVNGISREEFYLDQTFTSMDHDKKAAKNGIYLYNEIRLHLSLEDKTYNNVHQYAS